MWCWDGRRWGAKQDGSHTNRVGHGDTTFPSSPQKQDAFPVCVAKAVGPAASREVKYHPLQMREVKELISSRLKSGGGRLFLGCCFCKPSGGSPGGVLQSRQARKAPEISPCSSEEMGPSGKTGKTRSNGDQGAPRGTGFGAGTPRGLWVMPRTFPRE